MTVMKDIIGQELQVGDRVVFVQEHTELRRC